MYVFPCDATNNIGIDELYNSNNDEEDDDVHIG